MLSLLSRSHANVMCLGPTTYLRTSRQRKKCRGEVASCSISSIPPAPRGSSRRTEKPIQTYQVIVARYLLYSSELYRNITEPFAYLSAGWILENEYGASLANRPTPDSTPPLISRTLVSAVAVACLRAQGHVGPQLHSHTLGLLKSHYETDAEETQTPHERWLSSEPGAEWLIQTVDGLCEFLELGQGD